jgi:hypothetical protein
MSNWKQKSVLRLIVKTTVLYSKTEVPSTNCRGATVAWHVSHDAAVSHNHNEPDIHALVHLISTSFFYICSRLLLSWIDGGGGG